MKSIRQLAGLVLLVLMIGYPAMACLIPGAEMSKAERACCKHMVQQCGSMNTGSSHPCCRKEVSRPNVMLHAATAQTVPPIAIEPAAVILANPHTLQVEFSFFELHPPPESPPGTSSILRI